MDKMKPPTLSQSVARPAEIPKQAPLRPEIKPPEVTPQKAIPQVSRDSFAGTSIARSGPTVPRPDVSVSSSDVRELRSSGSLPRPSLEQRVPFGQQFESSTSILNDQIQNLRWYQKIPGFSAKPELVRQHALHTEAAQHVQTPEEAILADALLKLPPKNRPNSIKKALEMTRAGEVLLPQVVSGQVGLRDANKERVAQLQWALYNKAIQQLESQAQQKGSPTREQLIGGMTVLDDGGKVAQFMQAVARKGTGTGSYTRPSSHFQETRDTSLGMDFADSTIPLPAGKKTVLFGTKDGGSSTYLKGEYSGYDRLSDRMGHVFDFIKTNILGQRDVGRREKFIPKELKEKYKALGGQELDAKQVKARGIAYMLDMLPADKRQAFEQLAIAKGYNNPQMRKGEEIIVPRSELGFSGAGDAQQTLARELATIKRTRAAAEKTKGKMTPLETGISAAFGTGVKPSNEFTDAFNELRKKHPDVAKLAIGVMRNPTRDRVEQFFMTWVPSVNAANISDAAKAQLMPLAANIYDQYLQTNIQFAEDHSAHNFSEPGRPLFPREVSARQEFAAFASSLPDSDPRKLAAQTLVRAAAKEGFNLELTANPGSTDPYLAIARGQDIVAGPDGFKSVLAMQQGDRATYRVDRLDLPGADALSRQEKENIFRLLKTMEGPKTDAERLQAFDSNFDKFALDGSTYLNPAQRAELRSRLAGFAYARDESMRSIFSSVTGHDEMGRIPT